MKLCVPGQVAVNQKQCEFGDFAISAGCNSKLTIDSSTFSSVILKGDWATGSCPSPSASRSIAITWTTITPYQIICLITAMMV
ncbi:hypothetical protein PILCRDRAFT_264202 [Piloderma croceum F 1598]|uniref:Uncharacterized protein n=1 Tax=Piloderma croceum (strain F 1598) TaxID=765440 RepID=A0A0C3GB80_PILCF|nr:hypothetical protein PILCRDRAFT_264202 [Piloderma croceum F 1598]